MTPVHPIETSGAARRSRDRRQSGWRRGPVFQVPSDEPPANGVRLPMVQPAQSTALVPLSTDSGHELKYASHSSHAFVDTVERAARMPVRVTGWFLDLIV